MRLIDADLALEKIRVLEKEPDYQHEDEDWSVGLCMAEQAIDEVPTSDVVEQIFADLGKLFDANFSDCYGTYDGKLGIAVWNLKKKYGVK